MGGPPSHGRLDTSEDRSTPESTTSRWRGLGGLLRHPEAGRASRASEYARRRRARPRRGIPVPDAPDPDGELPRHRPLDAHGEAANCSDPPAAAGRHRRAVPQPRPCRATGRPASSLPRPGRARQRAARTHVGVDATDPGGRGYLRDRPRGRGDARRLQPQYGCQPLHRNARRVHGRHGRGRLCHGGGRTARQLVSDGRGNS